LWKDGTSVDQTERARLVFVIRQDLRSWDGKLSHLASLKGHVETYIKDSGWPAKQPGAPTIAPVPPRAAAAGRVEQDFSLG
jgi:hypothetical protein